MEAYIATCTGSLGVMKRDVLSLLKLLGARIRIWQVAANTQLQDISSLAVFRVNYAYD